MPLITVAKKAIRWLAYGMGGFCAFLGALVLIAVVSGLRTPTEHVADHPSRYYSQAPRDLDDAPLLLDWIGNEVASDLTTFAALRLIAALPDEAARFFYQERIGSCRLRLTFADREPIAVRRNTQDALASVHSEQDRDGRWRWVLMLNEGYLQDATVPDSDRFATLVHERAHILRLDPPGPEDAIGFVDGRAEEAKWKDFVRNESDAEFAETIFVLEQRYVGHPNYVQFATPAGRDQFVEHVAASFAEIVPPEYRPWIAGWAYDWFHDRD